MRKGWIAIAVCAVAACNGATPSEPVQAAPVATTISPQIAWPAGAADTRALAALGGDAPAQLARSPVPVLAPSAADALESPAVVVGPEYYAITGRAHGATVTIQGTRAQHAVEGVGPIEGDRAIRRAKGFVTVNEGIRVASWMENGAAYSIDVECADPTGDARCTSDAFVLGLAERLAYVGGAR